MVTPFNLAAYYAQAEENQKIAQDLFCARIVFGCSSMEALRNEVAPTMRSSEFDKWFREVGCKIIHQRHASNEAARAAFCKAAALSQSKEAAAVAKATTRHCAICVVDIAPASWEKHLQTAGHTKKAARVAAAVIEGRRA